MTWTYQQSTGEMASPNGAISQCYSGNGDGENNPAFQNEKGMGPIPRGVYTIGASYHDPKKGPCVMRLTPDSSNEIFGRAGFLIHGDNSKHDDSASEGCIIAGPLTRQTIDKSTDKTLTVIE